MMEDTVNKRITVFTPTYNRAHLLHRCYESLLKQKNKSFKWLIIDDGSTDNTRDIVKKWINEHKIDISYVYKDNGGLHTGYNKAIELLDTELCVCIDSDDWLVDDAIHHILNFWDKNKEDDCAGLIGLDIDIRGNVIGDKLPNINKVDPMRLLSDKIIGDKKYVLRTDLYKKVSPMPVFNNEKNFNPHYMVLKLSKDYKFLVDNRPYCIVDYQDDGMSANIFHQYINSPNSFMEYRRLIMSLPNTPFKYLCRTTIHYISSAILAKNKNYIKQSPRKVLTTLLTPLGYVLYLYVKSHGDKKVKMK